MKTLTVTAAPLEAPRREIQPFNPASSRDLVIDPLIDRFDLIYLARKYWWKLLILPLVCGLLALGFCLTRQPLFRSTGLVQVDANFESIIQLEKIEGNGQSDQQALQSLAVTVVADSVILRVVDRLELRNQPGFLPENLARKPNLSDAQLLRFLRQKRISASLLPETRLIEISVLDPDPERSRLIASSFITEFQAFIADQVRAEAEQARASLKQQSEVARLAALESEEKLKEFRESQPGLPVEQDHSLFSARLTRVGEELNLASFHRGELESQKAVLDAIDPDISPLEIIEVANYQNSAHVTNLLNALSLSRANLSKAETLYTDLNPLLRSAQAEVERNEAELRELARSIKAAVDARFETAQRKEEALGAELAGLVNQLSDMKSLGSEFRALHQEAERDWLIHQGIQTKLGDSTVGTELASQIVTVVSEPLLPYKKAKPLPLLYIAVGGGVGSLLSAGWLAIIILAGLPFSHPAQAEQRLGIPVVANWSRLESREPSEDSTKLLQLIGNSRNKAIQIAAIGLNGTGKSVALRVAQCAAQMDRKTLLILVNPDRKSPEIRPSGFANLFICEVLPEVILNPERFATGLHRLQGAFENIFVEAGGASDPALARAISAHLDMDVIVVDKDAMSKQQVEDQILRLRTASNAQGAALILIEGHSSNHQDATATDPGSATASAESTSSSAS